MFNVEQIDGLPAHFHARIEPPKPVERIEHAEPFFEASGATILQGGNRAFYEPSADVIQMPPRDRLRHVAADFGVLGHETVRWASAPSRLVRELGKEFGDVAFAAEDLV